jgi:T5SS/PEP-CTERM-associated repeat protein
LTISNKASLSAAGAAASPALVLGLGAGGSGTLTVTGLTSRATLLGQLNVGAAGTGSLLVENQGTAVTGGSTLAPSQGVDVATASGGSGGITVTGTQSLLSNTGKFVVGDAGLGSLAILAGATVITTPGAVSGLAGLVISNSASATGSSANISGTGSQLNVTGLLDVGAAGSGSLQISGGAVVNTGSLDAANIASAVGQISVSGSGSDLIVANAATVADDGTGVLSVLNGATFSAQSLTVGSQTDSSGALVVSGSGSLLSISGQLNIGTALGTGDLTVGPGAVVNASVVNLQGGVVLEGGVLDPTVYIENGGSTTGGFGTIASDYILLEGTILSNGSKTGKETEVVEGTIVGGGTANIKGSVSVNGPGILQIGTHDTIELTGAVLNAATTTFTDNLTPTGTYTVNNSVIDVVFQDSTGVLQIDDIAGFAGTVAAWKGGDSFIITGGTLSNLGVTNTDTLTFSDSGTGAGAGGIDSIIFGSGISATGFDIVNGNTVQVMPCFAKGTRIRTNDGWIAVEDLRAGDIAVTADGAEEAIVWVGQRAVNCAAHPRPEAVWPVRVRAGAFGDNVPVRDLYLSPDHAVFVDNVLVPVKLLINGSSIARAGRDRVEYFHVELPRHSVILAEGLTVESYLDTGDRADFGVGGATRLFPDFSGSRTREAAMLWETHGCAQLVLSGDRLASIRRGLKQRAAMTQPVLRNVRR